MNNFYVTFGSKYRSVPHPKAPWVHPDGYALILAATETEARNFAFAEFGDHWSNIYTQETMEFEFFPKGCLKTFEIK